MILKVRNDVCYFRRCDGIRMTVDFSIEEKCGILQKNYLDIDLS